MTDAELAAKKLGEIETYLADLQRLGCRGLRDHRSY